jgi:hypothetical protein
MILIYVLYKISGLLEDIRKGLKFVASLMSENKGGSFRSSKAETWNGCVCNYSYQGLMQKILKNRTSVGESDII